MINKKTKNILFVILILSLTTFVIEKLQKDKKESISVDSFEEPIINEEIKVYVRGLGKYSEKTLKDVSLYIKDFYGYECVIESDVKTSKEMYSKDGISLEVSKCVGKLKRKNKKTIYVTDENIVSDGMNLRGGTIWGTNTVILESTKHNKKTVLHEIGHTLGLQHCENKNCLMSIYNDDYEVKNFCNNCKKKLKK